MGLVTKEDGWRLSDEVWEKMAPLIPKPKDNHPLGGHRRRIPDRQVMQAILFVLRTGCQWKALDGTGMCSGSTAHRRFLEWVEAGVFERFWQEGLLCYDELKGLDWSWLAMDGAITKAPVAGSKKRVRIRRTEASKGSSAAC